MIRNTMICAVISCTHSIKFNEKAIVSINVPIGEIAIAHGTNHK
jgi:hypothetical protein